MGREWSYCRHQLYVLLAGELEETVPVMLALDWAIHSHDGETLEAGPPEKPANEQHWAFAGQTDSLHAAEIARGLLNHTAAGMRWQLWLFAAGELLFTQTNSDRQGSLRGGESSD
jgi:hypothetical protein